MLPQPPAHETTVLDSTQSRFYGRHSAIAFPYLLGLELEADPVPRLNCHAWNVNLRDKPVNRMFSTLVTAIDLQAAKGYLQVFFARVHPTFSFLDVDVFMRRCSSLWEGQGQGSSFECLAASVIILGSYFADEPHVHEAEIARLCDDLLNDPAATLVLDPCHVGAMIYNCLYMRLTSSPTISWIRSCTMMHAAESIGLHKDFEELSKALNAPQVLDLKESNYRARMFWVGWSVHQILAMQHGRAPVKLEEVNCKYPFTSSEESATAAFCELGKAVPTNDINQLLGKTAPERTEYFSELLKKLGEIKKAHPVVSLSAADVCFCAYRRLLVTGSKPNDKRNLDDINNLCSNALSAAETLVTQGQPWWNIVESIFQMVCVLVSLDAQQNAGLLKRALKLLEQVSERFPTESTSDALGTAHSLVQALVAKKRRELAALDDLTLGSSTGDPLDVESSADVGLTGDEGILSQTELPDLFARWTDPFAWSESAGVEWNYPQE